MKIRLKSVFFVLCFFFGKCLLVKSQGYFSNKNLHYLNQYCVTGGILVNQGHYQYFGYKPNTRALFNFNMNGISIKHISINIGVGVRKKSLIGYGNYPWLRLINNLQPTSPSYMEPYHTIDFLFLNTDASIKFKFFIKYKLQPFIFIGARHNEILSGSNLEDYNKHHSSDFKKRDNYVNSFVGFGLDYEINSNFSFVTFFEKNDDYILNKQAYFSTSKNFDEIGFLSYSFQIGIQYTLSKSAGKSKN